MLGDVTEGRLHVSGEHRVDRQGAVLRLQEHRGDYLLKLAVDLQELELHRQAKAARGGLSVTSTSSSEDNVRVRGAMEQPTDSSPPLRGERQKMRGSFIIRRARGSVDKAALPFVEINVNIKILGYAPAHNIGR